MGSGLQGSFPLAGGMLFPPNLPRYLLGSTGRFCDGLPESLLLVAALSLPDADDSVFGSGGF